MHECRGEPGDDAREKCTRYSITCHFRNEGSDESVIRDVRREVEM